MVQAPFFEGLHGSQRIPDGPASTEGACTSIKPPELTGIYGLASRKAFYLLQGRWPAAQLITLCFKRQSMKKRRQHYVWRHYLNSWAADEMIWCFRNGSIYNTNLVNVAQQRDFYKINKLSAEEMQLLRMLAIGPYKDRDIDLNAGWIRIFQMAYNIKELASSVGIDKPEIITQIDTAIHNIEEEYHSYIEGNSARYLESLLSGDISFYYNADDCMAFIYFISLQYMRTKKIQENVVRSIKTPLPVDFRNIWPILRHVYATQIAKNLYLQKELYCPVLLTNSTYVPLLTSDQPIINTHAAKLNMNKPVEELEFYYPISQNTALLITPDRKYRDTRLYVMNYDDVCMYNTAMVTCSHEQVFSSCEHSLRFFCEGKT